MHPVSIDLFDLNEPRDLFRILQASLREFSQNPTEKDFLFLALGFTHLREWIAETGHDEIKKKLASGKEMSKGEKFFLDIYNLESFKIIQSLCNRSKHHITKEGFSKTSKMSKFRVGLGRAGDHLGQTYFLIDGIDSRNHFYELIKKYSEWFESDA